MCRGFFEMPWPKHSMLSLEHKLLVSLQEHCLSWKKQQRIYLNDSSFTYLPLPVCPWASLFSWSNRHGSIYGMRQLGNSMLSFRFLLDPAALTQRPPISWPVASLEWCVDCWGVFSIRSSWNGTSAALPGAHKVFTSGGYGWSSSWSWSCHVQWRSSCQLVGDVRTVLCSMLLRTVTNASLGSGLSKCFGAERRTLGFQVPEGAGWSLRLGFLEFNMIRFFAPKPFLLIEVNTLMWPSAILKSWGSNSLPRSMKGRSTTIAVALKTSQAFMKGKSTTFLHQRHL